MSRKNTEHRTSNIQLRWIRLFGVQSFALFVSFTVFLATSAFAQQPAEPETGDALARELRTMQPGANSEITGILKIRSPDRRIDIPVVSKTITNENSWKMIYEVSATTNTPAEKLIVIHSPSGPNKYLHARAATPKDPMPTSEAD